MGPFLQAFEVYLDKCGARFLCRYLQTDVREGNADHLTVIIEFHHWPQQKLPMRRLNTKRCSGFDNLYSDVSLSILEEGDHAVH